jgi:CBS domain-containing protein
MTADVRCVDSADTVLAAARQMAEFGVGALPICGQDNKLKGMITDRDTVVKVLAAGKDPSALHTSELAQGEAVTIGADDCSPRCPRTEHEPSALGPLPLGP